jgi:hypothetical protein
VLRATKSRHSGGKGDLRKYCVITILFIVIAFDAHADSVNNEADDRAFHTDVTSGDVSGIWTLERSPYRINGEITVPNDSTLTIEPGVEVDFAGHYKFNIQGRLLAIGTPQDSIHFTAADPQTGWHGIRFINTPGTNDSSRIVYCSFTHGKANTGDYNGDDRRGGAIFIRGFSKVSVSHSLFEYNMNEGNIAAATGGAAIFVAEASPRITNNTFLNNTGTTDCAILCWYTNAVIADNLFARNSGPHGPVFCAYYSPIISGNIISHNVTTRAGGGIFNMTTNARITNNIIICNRCFGGEGEGGGIKCWVNDQSVSTNNTIAYNSAAHGGGICCNSNSDPIFFNNIIWGNTSPDGNQVNLLDTQSDPAFLFCDIQGGKEGFGGSGAGTYYTGIYESNIDLDPLFKDTALVNYSLSSPSHCIGAGFDSIEVLGSWYYAPPFCKIGNPRPSPAGTRPDIGACESLLGTPVVVGVEGEMNSPEGFALLQNYPNPFNPSTCIGFKVAGSGVWGLGSSWVRLSVYDVLGREVAVLVNEEKETGFHEVRFDASGLSSGVYVYRIQVRPLDSAIGSDSKSGAGSYVQAKTLVVLK